MVSSDGEITVGVLRYCHHLTVLGKCHHEGDGDIEQERATEAGGIEPSGGKEDGWQGSK